jgi:hypothetical protein
MVLVQNLLEISTMGPQPHPPQEEDQTHKQDKFNALKPDLWSICQIQELAYGVVGTAKHK